jgi:dsDNA-specific endonuclease/ATPase MutS2
VNRLESTKDSLVLLDELGTGTDPVEGAALAIAMVRSFCESGLKGGGFGGSRLLVATTHHGAYIMMHS